MTISNADSAALSARELPNGELVIDITRDSDQYSLEDPSHPLYDTAKVTIQLPAELYDALRVASMVEDMPQNDLVVHILSRALAQMPRGFFIEPSDP